MANRDQASRRGLMAYSYKESVENRLTKANNEAIKNNVDYRYVKLGDEIFHIHKDMVEVYYNSDRGFKRGMKKKYIKMMKKSKREIDRLAKSEAK